MYSLWSFPNSWQAFELKKFEDKEQALAALEVEIEREKNTYSPDPQVSELDIRLPIIKAYKLSYNTAEAGLVVDKFWVEQSSQ